MSLIGYEGYLYISTSTIDRIVGGSGTADVSDVLQIAPVASTLVGFHDISDAIDVSPDTSEEKVETTTRQLARNSVKGERIITPGGSIQFGVAAELLTENSILHHLWKLGVAGTVVTMMDLNSNVDNTGAAGLSGQFKLNAPSTPKTLKGHQVMTFTASVEALSQWVVSYDDTGTQKLIGVDSFAGDV